MTELDDLLKDYSCSLRFLRSIKYNLLLIENSISKDGSKRNPNDRIDDDNDGSTIESYLRFEKGYERLHNHPELFPNKTIKEAFDHDICKIVDSIMDMLTLCLESEIEHENFIAFCAQNTPQLPLPSQDQNRKPWQQFLHNKAPGSGIEKPFIRDMSGSTQAIPWAACRIAKAMNEELQSIFRGLESVCAASQHQFQVVFCNTELSAKLNTTVVRRSIRALGKGKVSF